MINISRVRNDTHIFKTKDSVLKHKDRILKYRQLVVFSEDGRIYMAYEEDIYTPNFGYANTGVHLDGMPIFGSHNITMEVIYKYDSLVKMLVNDVFMKAMNEDVFIHRKNAHITKDGVLKCYTENKAGFRFNTPVMVENLNTSLVDDLASININESYLNYRHRGGNGDTCVFYLDDSSLAKGSGMKSVDRSRPHLEVYHITLNKFNELFQILRHPVMVNGFANSIFVFNFKNEDYICRVNEHGVVALHYTLGRLLLSDLSIPEIWEKVSYLREYASDSTKEYENITPFINLDNVVDTFNVAIHEGPEPGLLVKGYRFVYIRVWNLYVRFIRVGDWDKLFDKEYRLQDLFCNNIFKRKQFHTKVIGWHKIILQITLEHKSYEVNKDLYE